MDQHENEILKTLARCRVLLDSAELSEDARNAINLLLSEKMIEKEMIKGEPEELVVYLLTDKGEAFVKKNIKEVHEIYRGFVLKHDLRLSEFYLRLSPKLRDTWMTKDDFIRQYQLPGTVDGAFINENGELEAVKVFHQTAEYSSLSKVEKFLKATEISKVQYIICS